MSQDCQAGYPIVPPPPPLPAPPIPLVTAQADKRTSTLADAALPFIELHQQLYSHSTHFNLFFTHFHHYPDLNEHVTHPMTL